MLGKQTPTLTPNPEFWPSGLADKGIRSKWLRVCCRQNVVEECAGCLVCGIDRVQLHMFLADGG